MSRRAVSSDQEFGSDSFLDIIANIVGILIILIVVAGLRVANQPKEVASAPAVQVAAEDTEAPAAEQVPPLPEVLSIPEVDTATDEEVNALLDTIAEVEAELDQLQAEADTLDAKLRQQQAFNMWNSQKAEQEQQREALEERLVQLKRHLNSVALTSQQITGTLQSLDDRKLAVLQQLNNIALKTRTLREKLEDIGADTPPVSTLQHRILPVSRTNSETQIHFRLEAGRVAIVPLDRLVERAHSQLRRRISTLRKLGRLSVSAGPENGFIMDYDAQLTNVRGLVTNFGAAALQPSYIFEVKPSTSVRSEPVETAIKPGSRFRQILEAAEPGLSLIHI